MAINYFHKYLEVAPFSLALWRAFEAQKIDTGYKSLHKKGYIPGKKINPHFIFKRPLLDLGCGFGEFAGVFFERQVEVGIDISIEDLMKAKKNNKHKKLLIADARNLPFSQNKFSTVISNSTIEHIPHPEKVMQEVYRVLKPGGIFIYTVPTIELNSHLFFPELFQKLNLKGLKSFYLTKYHQIFKHVNIFPAQKWHKITKDAGFQIIYSKGTFPRSLTLIFDLFLISSLPSQLGRWMLGDRWIWGLSKKKILLDKLFADVANDKNVTDSNILVIAKKK